MTNDAWQPLRASRRFQAPRPERRPRRFSRQRGERDHRDAGPLVDDRRALRRRAGPARARRAPARAAGHRHARRRAGRGRPRRLRAACTGSFAKLETLGVCRRGYFVEGLGGAQFALPGAVERLREEHEEDEPLVLAAADPAQPYGAAIPWPKRADGRAARVAGAFVVTLGGEPALFVERGGRSLVPLRDPDEDWLRPALEALVAHARRTGIKRLAVERFDGEPVAESLAMPLLVEAGLPRRAPARRPARLATRGSCRAPARP